MDMTRPAGLPWLAGRAGGAPFLIEPGGVVSVDAFQARVAAVAAGLPPGAAVINLCERRGAFLAGYAAALAAGLTTLLPASRAPEAVASVAALMGRVTHLDDADVAASGAKDLAASSAGALPGWAVDPDHLAMIGFTSGSTGTPSQHAKYWGSVAVSTARNAAAIRAALPAAQREHLPWIVGTVPSQHMYGMELTVLLPLLAGMALHCARPLLPAEVAKALGEVPEPRVLVSTPAHLRAIVASGVALPTVAVTLCATAPLDAQLAAQVEQATGGVLVEMFGATETCILGTRETAREVDWHPYAGVQFTPTEDGTRVDAPWFRAPQLLQDRIELTPAGCFRLAGRNADLVDVAGKRASLADLTQRLLRVPGVIDGVVFQPESTRGLVQRLAALVVAPGLTAEQVREALVPALDPVFMPRPLLVVPALPRNATGKLPRQALLEAFRAAQS